MPVPRQSGQTSAVVPFSQPVPRQVSHCSTRSMLISFSQPKAASSKLMATLVRRLSPRCGGKGRIIHQPCKACHGSGQLRRRKTLKVTIPAGIDNGQTISLRGQGNAGRNGGPAGDLLIVIAVRPHEIFRREGTSVLCEAPITFTQAVLGAELEIPTIDGKVKYSIPEGTQSGTTFRLKGKGIPGLNGRARGDQYVTVYIETPRNLNREQKEALRKFSDTLGESNYEQRKSFFGKFKL